MLVFTLLLEVLLFQNLSQRLACCPYEAVLGLQVWRFVLSPFVERGVFGVLIGCFVFASMGAQYERKYGTIAFFYFFIAINLCANLLFCFAVLFLAPVFPSFNLLSPSMCANGVWGSVLALLVVQTQRSNQPTMSFWGLCNIPTKIYPWFLLFLFALLGGSILDHLCAVLMGYAFVRGYLERVVPRDLRFIAWENSESMKWLTAAPGHIPWTGNLNAAGDGEDGGSSSEQSQSRTGNVISGGVIRSGTQHQQPAPAASGRNSEKSAKY